MWNLETRSNASPIWRAMAKAADFLEDGFNLKFGNSQVSFWFDHWHPKGLLCNKVNYVHISDTDFKICDVWENGVWHLERLFTPMSEELRASIMNTVVWLHGDSNDCLAWNQDVSGSYKVSSGCAWLYRRLHGDVPSKSWS